MLAPAQEPIPGYRLTRFLGKGGFGEVWEATAPGDLRKAVKISSLESANVDECHSELEGLRRLKGIRHPYLLSIERFEIVDRQLIVVMELAEMSLADRFWGCIQSGLVGIPRPELLGYMAEAAEAIDLLNCKHGLMHLDIKPANLFLSAGHVKVADYGLVRFRDAAISVTALVATAPFASPELLAGRIEASTDQYSLAVTYCELLTGQRHEGGDIPLTHLPAEDRPIVARALHPDAAKRFDNCTAFVEALALTASRLPAPVSGSRFQAAPSALVAKPHATNASVCPRANGKLETIESIETTRLSPRAPGPITKRLAAAEPTELQFEKSFETGLPLEGLAAKLRGFIDASKAEVLNADPRKTVLRIGSRRWLGLAAGPTVFLTLEASGRNPNTGARTLQATIWCANKNQSRPEIQTRANTLFELLTKHLAVA